jgi:hypothetical protein
MRSDIETLQCSPIRPLRTLINNPVRIRPRLLRELSGYDTVLVDCAGNLHDTPLLAEVLAVADFAVSADWPVRLASHEPAARSPVWHAPRGAG